MEVETVIVTLLVHIEGLAWYSVILACRDVAVDNLIPFNCLGQQAIPL